MKRGGPLQRHARPQARTGLARTPISPGTAGLQRQATAGARKTARDTGFSAAVKLAIRTRAGNGDPERAHCEACGIWLGRYGGQCQHIAARGMGGTTRPEASRADGGVLLCGTPQTGDHGLCEARDEHMRAMGFWRHSWEKPGPIMLHGAGGGGVTVWLTPDGRYSTVPPEAAA